jgi:Ca2+-binding RTX toxin-like protein
LGALFLAPPNASAANPVVFGSDRWYRTYFLSGPHAVTCGETWETGNDYVGVEFNVTPANASVKLELISTAGPTQGQIVSTDYAVDHTPWGYSQGQQWLFDGKNSQFGTRIRVRFTANAPGYSETVQDKTYELNKEVDFWPAETDPPCIYGTAGPDVIRGTPGDDRIYALGGDDVVYGNGGDDRIIGGRGNDKLFGSGGGDTLEGGKGTDKCVGGAGKDVARKCEKVRSVP